MMAIVAIGAGFKVQRGSKLSLLAQYARFMILGCNKIVWRFLRRSIINCNVIKVYYIHIFHMNIFYEFTHISLS